MRRSTLVTVLSVAAPFAFACAASPAPAPPASVTLPPPSASTTAAPSPSADPRAQPWSPPNGTSDDTVVEACAPIVDVLRHVKTAAEARAGLADMEKAPPPLPAAQWTWCREQLARIIDRKAKAEASGTPEGAVEAEAKNMIGSIAKGMAAAYERETLPPPGATHTGVVRALCPSAKPVPATIDRVAEKKYQSAPGDWSKDKGWSCLKFEIDSPQWWQYEVKADAKTFTVFARRKQGSEIVEMSLAGMIDAASGDLRIADSIVELRKPAK